MAIAVFEPLLAIYRIGSRRYLITQLVRREVLAKYRGSLLGIGWSFLYPLLLLAGFTMVFGGVFGGRWGDSQPIRSGLEMALFIYCGLAVFTPVAEILTAAPKVLTANQNFIKKIVFPVEILPLVAAIAAMIHGAAHLLLLAGAAAFTGHASTTMLLAPVALVPVLLFSLGIAWAIAAAGAYIRDLAHGMPVLAQFLMFVLPVFYPSDAAPGPLRSINAWNPITLAIDDLRRTLLNGQAPDWERWLVAMLIGTGVLVLGLVFFMRCREEFADVV